MKVEKRYICVGESFIDGVQIGYCGDIHTINEWLEICFPHKNAVEYFKGDPIKEILDYILKNCGKRLEVFK